MTNAQISTMMQREYYARPEDERFPDIRAMIASAQEDRDLSKEAHYNWRDLRWTADPTTDPTTPPDRDTAGLYLESPKARAALTHWSFGQAARMLGAPAGFLRDGLNPEIAARALNYRIQQQPHGSDAVLLVRAANGRPLPQVRAVTSQTYARIWDATLYREIDRQLGGTLTAPPTWKTDPRTGAPLTGGAYRGDRDSAAILISGGSIVTDPSARHGQDGGALYRGVIVRNSEVGSCALHLILFLYRAICGNHLIMGINGAKTYTRRHFGQNAARDTMRELYRLAREITTAGAQQDEAIIRGLIDHEIAHTRDAVIDELQALGWTREQAAAAYDRCEQTEPALSPRSYWGIAQGATRASQDSPYQDERHAWDVLAGQLLSRGRKLVTA